MARRSPSRRPGCASCVSTAARQVSATPVARPPSCYEVAQENSWGAHMARWLAAALAAALSLSFGEASAQSWPQRPMTFIVSQSAGASPDVMARMIASRLSISLGQTIIVENKAGAGNVIGATAAARAAPDGYTFFFATSAALVTNPYMVKNLSDDPMKDFAPVSLVTRSHQIIVVHPDVPAKTLAELIALDKASPGKL